MESKIKATELKLERAEKLINGLGGEKARWSYQIESLTHTYDHIVGDVLLSSAFVAYLGAFTFDYRQVNNILISRFRITPALLNYRFFQ